MRLHISCSYIFRFSGHCLFNIQGREFWCIKTPVYGTYYKQCYNVNFYIHSSATFCTIFCSIQECTSSRSMWRLFPFLPSASKYPWLFHFHLAFTRPHFCGFHQKSLSPSLLFPFHDHNTFANSFFVYVIARLPLHTLICRRGQLHTEVWASYDTHLRWQWAKFRASLMNERLLSPQPIQ